MTTMASRSSSGASSAYTRIGCSGVRSSAELGLFGCPRGGLHRPQLADPRLVVARSRAGQRCENGRQISVEAGGDGARVGLVGCDTVNSDEFGVGAEHAAEAEPEVHRHPDHQRNVGLPQRF